MRASLLLALILSLSLISLSIIAKESDYTPGIAGNKIASVTATAYIDRDEITKLAGTDLGPYITAVQVTVQPKAGKLKIGRDDFVLLTFKDGEHTKPLAPSELGKHSDMTLKAVRVGPDGPMAGQNTPIWQTPGTGNTVQLPSNGAHTGNAHGVDTTTAVVNDEKDTKEKTNGKKKDPVVELLKRKVLPETETDQPVSGLLLFNLEKQKLKDLELIYHTSEGPLKVRFK
jgi:hypothetical protein